LIETEPPSTKPASGVEIVLRNPNGYPETRVSRVRPWLERMIRAVAAGGGSLGVKFVGDREMRRLNRRYRDKDRSTDVLSFAGGPTPEGDHLGDLVISVPAARRQAAERGHSAEREIRALLLHGVLHCLGFDHETDDGEMARLERRLRRKWVGTDV
jgi:probable rRNA maturation factor